MIGRRAWLASVVGAVGAVAGPACAREGRRVVPCAFDEVPPEVGHRLRGSSAELIARVSSSPAIRVDVVVVGGGVAGLAASRALRRGGVESFLLLELDQELGGTSASGTSGIGPVPFGAHYLPVPRASNEELVTFLDEIGLVERVGGDGLVSIREPYLVRSPESRIFENGYFHEGERPLDGASPASREAFERFEALVDGFAERRDASGRRAFELPVERSSDEPELLALDRASAAAFLTEHGLEDPRLHAFLDYGTRDDFGCSLATCSAWAMLHYHASRRLPASRETAPHIAFPEGNAAFVDRLAHGLGDRIRRGAIALDVRTLGDVGQVIGLDRTSGEPFRIEARRIVVATPKHVAARMVAEVREDPARPFAAFTYAPWVVGNLHLRRPPRSRGLPFAWDSIVAGSEALGYVNASHQRMRETGPTVLTHYRALVDPDPRAARAGLLAASADELGRLILDDLRRAHPDLEDVTTRITIRRHGHGMIRPVPGFFTSASRTSARRPRGVVHFGHTDDSGMALFEEAFGQGMRAGGEVVAMLHGNPGTEPGPRL